MVRKALMTKLSKLAKLKSVLENTKKFFTTKRLVEV